MAPVVIALRRNPRYRTVLVSTSQHGAMLGQALGAFGIAPDIDLELRRVDSSLEGFLASALVPLGQVMKDLRPTLTLVQGDTMTVLAAAQASFFQRVPVGHIEAGLRSFDMEQPFPEEANRRLTSVLAGYHFAPTAGARDNLIREGTDPERIWVTGNTGVDAMGHLKFTTPVDPRVAAIDFDGSRVILLTAHRRENHGKPLADICNAVRDIVREFPDVKVVVPVHANPAVKVVMHTMLGDLDRVHLLPPLDYGDLVYVLRRCTLVLTDSGGIQEDAPSCDAPVLILREVTERPEVVECGAGLLVGTERKSIVAAVTTLLTDDDALAAMANARNPFGDGHASDRIVHIIGESFERRLAVRVS